MPYPSQRPTKILQNQNHLVIGIQKPPPPQGILPHQISKHVATINSGYTTTHNTSHICPTCDQRSNAEVPGVWLNKRHQNLRAILENQSLCIALRSRKSPDLEVSKVIEVPPNHPVRTMGFSLINAGKRTYVWRIMEITIFHG